MKNIKTFKSLFENKRWAIMVEHDGNYEIKVKVELTNDESPSFKGENNEIYKIKDINFNDEMTLTFTIEDEKNILYPLSISLVDKDHISGEKSGNKIIFISELKNSI